MKLEEAKEKELIETWTVTTKPSYSSLNRMSEDTMKPWAIVLHATEPEHLHTFDRLEIQLSWACLYGILMYWN